MDMSERPTNGVRFSWSSLRQKSLAPQPTSNEPPKHKKKRKQRMQKRRLKDDEICVHNRPGCRTLTFSGKISSVALSRGMEYCCCHIDEGKFIVAFYKNQRENLYAKCTYIKNSKTPSASFTKKQFVEGFCRFFKLPDGNYYASVVSSKIRKESDEYILYEVTSITEPQPMVVVKEPNSIFETEMRTCAKCGRQLPLSEFYQKNDGYQSWCKDCCKDHGRLRNGTTGEYRANPTISEATDNQLYDELKRRGYEGKLTRVNTLE